jgi:hypothetical protein
MISSRVLLEIAIVSSTEALSLARSLKDAAAASWALLSSLHVVHAEVTGGVHIEQSKDAKNYE